MSASHEVTGVDGSPEMLAVARSSVPDGRFVRGDLLALPLSNESMDLVVCSLALTHVADLAGALREMTRVTRPGGRVVLSDIHPLSVAVLGQAFFRTEEGGTAFVRNLLHPIASYIDAFDGAGLRIVRCAEPEFVTSGSGLIGTFIPEAEKQGSVGCLRRSSGSSNGASCSRCLRCGS